MAAVFQGCQAASEWRAQGCPVPSSGRMGKQPWKRAKHHRLVWGALCERLWETAPGPGEQEWKEGCRLEQKLPGSCGTGHAGAGVSLQSIEEESARADFQPAALGDSSLEKVHVPSGSGTTKATLEQRYPKASQPVWVTCWSKWKTGGRSGKEQQWFDTSPIPHHPFASCGGRRCRSWVWTVKLSLEQRGREKIILGFMVFYLPILF